VILAVAAELQFKKELSREQILALFNRFRVTAADF
jgi:hypothetical protein